MKKWYESKTLWFNFLTGLVAVFGFIVSDQFPVFIPDQVVGYLVLAISIANAVLRFVTNKAVKV